MAYKKDYEKSRQREKAFAALLITRNNLAEDSSNKGYWPNWDISCTSSTGTISTFEVKYNSTYRKDNVIIETCRIIDKKIHPSGLSSTQADYYVLTFENDDAFYIIPTAKLKELVESNKGLKERSYDKAGYQLTVFQKKWLLSFATKL